MNNFELNKAITEILHPAEWEYWRKVDYCNNWNDLMPLVVEYNVEFGLSGGVVEHYYNDPPPKGILNQDNVQRTLAECLLKVLEKK